MEISQDIDLTRLPDHIAIIMDGNGRWAKARGLNRSMGHQEGDEADKRITEASTKLGLKYLTLYTFSTENWNRPAEEVAALMSLILTSLEEELFMKNNVRMRLIGDIKRLPEIVRESILALEQRTATNTGLVLTIALSYSSRWEITEAVKAIAADTAAGIITTADITEELITKRLATHYMPDPDLLIRTGGEVRLSNYLLWQCAYTEFYFCDTYWPDFSPQHLQEAIAWYQHRERRYGKTSEQVEQPSRTNN